jgi:hypothetical protein
MNARCPNATIVAELSAELLDVTRFLAEVHFLANAHTEFTHDVRERADMMVRKQHVEQEQHAKRHIQVESDEFLDTGAKHLDCDDVITDPRAMHLTETGRRDRYGLEVAEHVIHRTAEFRLDDAAYVLERIGRHLILEPADAAQVRFGEDVGARAEDLSELDERGTSPE